MTSKYKGVSWNKRDRAWNAKVQIANEHIYCGRHKSETVAARAVDMARIRRGLEPINILKRK